MFGTRLKTSIVLMAVTILLVVQYVMAGLEIADRGYVIETGRNVMDGPAQDLMNNEEMKRAYMGI